MKGSKSLLSFELMMAHNQVQFCVYHFPSPSRQRDMHHPTKLCPEAAALIPREPEAKEGILEYQIF